ncbi:MAG: gfo/Idh/MocA family oxidoreductase, partial [Bacteroidales bacterium]|nr:gfo/Idh/MocA family oxidoreductase [Bacteroidales bacterium]
PWNWRAWWDFGTGALGDMGCHLIDPAYMALKLGYPESFEASSSRVNTESAPIASKVTYYFPARENLPKIAMPPVTLRWYDGGLMPERPDELKDGEMLGDGGGGSLFIGSKGKAVCGTYGRNPKLLGKGYEGYEAPEILRRIETSHEMDWVRACKESHENRVLPSANFEYAGPFNEVVVMGNLAIRLQDLKRKLKWDAEKMEITNIGESDKIKVVTTDKFTVIDGHPHFDTKYATIDAKPAAEEYIKHNYREGWIL